MSTFRRFIPKRGEDKLHRVDEGATSDWENTPEQDRNIFQKVAAKTKGILTVGNMITVAGTYFVIDGIIDYINGNRLQGIVKVAGGRLCDVLDGVAAEKTKTRSRLGGGFDASVDLAQLAIGTTALALDGAIPVASTFALLAPKVVDTASVVTAQAREIKLDATAEAKMGAALGWAAITSYMSEPLVEQFSEQLSAGTSWLGHTLVALSFASRAQATYDYARMAFGRKPKQA